jgi:hypothetical protein
MALQKQLVHLNMTGGLQTKDDQFLVIPSKLVVADNVEFDDASTVVRRGGQKGQSYGTGPGTPDAPYRLFTNNGNLVLEGAQGDYRILEATGAAQIRNPVTVSGFAQCNVFRRAGMQTARVAGVTQKNSAFGADTPFYDGNYDCASIGNVTCYAFETRDASLNRQTIQVVVVDDSTGDVFASALLSDGAKVLVKPRVIATATQFFVYFGSFTSGASAFDIKSIPVSTGGGLGALSAAIYTSASVGVVENTSNDYILFDVNFRATVGIGLVARSNAAGFTLTFQQINSSDGATVLASNTLVPSARPISLTALSTDDGAVQRIHAFYAISTNVIRASHYNAFTGLTVGETTVGTGAGGTNAGRVCAIEMSTALIYLTFDSGLNLYDSTLRISSFNHTYGAISECASSSPYYIAGRIASVQGRLFQPLVLVSGANQGTYFVADLTGALNLGVAGALGAPLQMLARIDYGESALDLFRRRTEGRVPNAPVRGSTIILPYLKYETNVRLAGTANDTAYALSVARIDLDSQLGSAEVNGVTFLAGACPYIYDGLNMVEESFHHAPEIVSVTVNAGFSGTYDLPSMVAATYTICFTMAWQDNQGNWHESAPSAEAQVTTTAANYSFTPTLVLPNTQKANARLLMYRTRGSSTDTSLYLAVNTAGASVSTDAADSTIGSSEQLYTAGNVLPNTPAPACRHVSLFQRRLVLSGCGDGSIVHWSKQSDPGYGVEFSSGDPTHQTKVPAERGRAVATSEMDDRLVVFAESGIGLIDGQGPNASGTQGQYSEFRTIITEVGAAWASPKSIIRGPDGVWFRSPFGIRMVSRSGALALGPDGKQLGSEVDSSVSGNVVAISGGAKQQVRFFAGFSRCHVWDYQWKQWTRFTGMQSVDAAFADGRYYHVNNVSGAAQIRYTDNATYTDVTDAAVTAQAYSAYLELPWLAMAGLQAFQRIYRIMILGKNADGSVQPQTIGLSLNYDYQGAYSSDAPVVSVTPTAGGVIQFQHHFVQQKCEAIKIAIYFLPTTPGNAGRFRLTDLTLQVGVKTGTFKLPSSQRF